MKYCKYCKVEINKEADECILCGNTLSERDGKIDEVFPHIPYIFNNNYVFKVPLFISICIVVISFIIHSFFPGKINWHILVLIGLISLWVGLYNIIYRKIEAHKKIFQQLLIFSALTLFWDWFTGWKAWSITYIIPLLFIVSIILMYIAGKIMKLPVQSYIMYSGTAGLLGILPILFTSLGWTRNSYLSLLSVGVSIIFLSAIAIFKGQQIKDEWNKRMHI